MSLLKFWMPFSQELWRTFELGLGIPMEIKNVLINVETLEFDTVIDIDFIDLCSEPIIIIFSK